MKPNPKFINQPLEFWANIRLISQAEGYTRRGTGEVLIPCIKEIKNAFDDNQLDSSHIINKNLEPTNFGLTIIKYFEYRAFVLNTIVEKNLMDVEQAEEIYYQMQEKFKPTWNTPLNKQSGEMKKPAYFTGIINSILEMKLHGIPIDNNPRKLSIFTQNGKPLRTFSRWMDGAFPSTINPISVWEIKEYYYATTFGSRVADAVYETHLDGFEFEELRKQTNMQVLHYLMIDSHRTWWEKGRPYLCRIIDLLHMSYLDEVLFGKEVLSRLPEIVDEWITIYSKLQTA